MEYIRDPYLVLYLPLYLLDGASFMSKDAYGRLCTVTTALWRPNGYSFDGTNDYIDCGTDAVLPLGGNDRTVDGWFKFDAAIAHGARVFSYGTWAEDDALDINVITAPRISLNVAGHTNNYDGLILLTAGNWYHFAVVVNGSNIKSYINSVVDIDGAHTLTTISGGKIYIGRSIDAGSEKFDGIIGEVRVYSRALTPQEISHNYLSTKERYR